MKYILVIGDGMADTALDALNGKTPLASLDLPAFDRCAGSHFGRVRTVPPTLPPGSDTAILSIFGNDPCTCYTGRSVLEAAGMGVPVPKGCISFRVNLCAVLTETPGRPVIYSHNGGNIHGEEALGLMDALLHDETFAALCKAGGMTITPTDTFRHVGIVCSDVRDLDAVRFTEPHNVLMEPIIPNMPHLTRDTDDIAAIRLMELISNLMNRSYEVLKDHPINQKRIAGGQLPANMIWPWGAATAMELENFAEKYGHSGTVVSAVPLVWGIAGLGALKTPHVDGANGDLDTNYTGKVQTALDALASGDDFAAVHIEAPDEMAHAGSLEKKLAAIRNVCDLVVAPILAEMDRRGESYRLLLLPDHPTLLTTRTHDGTPVPYAIYDSRNPGTPRKFSEEEAAKQPLLDPGTKLMSLLFEQA